jgi:ribosome-binding factor A
VKNRPSPNRPNRVNEQIRRDLAELIPREVKDPRVGMVTVMSVEVTPDYAHAKIYVSSLLDGTEAKVASVAALNEASGYLHHLLFKRLHIHTVPKLKFLLDESGVRGLDLSLLIDRAVATRAEDE